MIKKFLSIAFSVLIATANVASAKVLKLNCLGEYHQISMGKVFPSGDVNIAAVIYEQAGEACLIFRYGKVARPEKCFTMSQSEQEFLIDTDRTKNKGSSVVYSEKTRINRYSGNFTFHTEEIFGGKHVNSYRYELDCKKEAEYKSEKKF